MCLLSPIKNRVFFKLNLASLDFLKLLTSYIAVFQMTIYHLHVTEQAYMLCTQLDQVKIAFIHVIGTYGLI